MAFIDADKVGYLEYWDLLHDSPSTNAKAIDAFNNHVRADDRVESVLLPIADGLTLARKH